MRISHFFVLASLVNLTLFGAEPAKRETNKTAGTVKSAPVFDAAGKRIIFGSKVLQIFPSGYLSFLDSGREISKVYFYGSTPYSSFLANLTPNISIPSQYGRGLGVDSFATDEAGKSFVVKGKIPYQKKGENELTGNYVFTVKLLGTGKISIRMELNRPAGKNGGMRIMWTTLQAVKYIADGKEYVFPKEKSKQNHHWRVKKIRVFTDQPAMSFELNTKSFMSVYARTGKLLALHPHKDKKAPDQEIIEVELDPQ